MPSTARDTLEKAKYFAAKAADSQPEDLVGFRHNLEAAIVFARSVTFHIQKEFAHAPGFDAWYKNWQDRLGSDKASRFFLDKRNFLLKKGRLEISRHISFKVTITASSKLTAKVTVVRGQPWYRRSPRIILEDLTYPMREWLHERKERRQEAKKRAQTREAQPPEIGIYFVEPEWNDKPALDHFDKYLKSLGSLAIDCESRFAPDTSAPSDTDPGS
jgi:hypothetical protein